MNDNPINNEAKNNMPRVRSSVFCQVWGEKKHLLVCIKVSLGLIYVCVSGAFFPRLFARFDDDSSANCSQIRRRHDVETPRFHVSHTSCHTSASWTWKVDWLYLCSLLHSGSCPFLFFLSFFSAYLETNNNKPRKDVFGHEQRDWEVTRTLLLQHLIWDFRSFWAHYCRFLFSC